MKAHDLWPGRAIGPRSAWMGSVVLGLLLMVASAWAQPPRSALPAAAPNLAAMARAADTAKAEIVAGAVTRVEIKNYEFLPAALTVPAGTTITWINRDDEPHTATSSEKVFASPGLDAGETFSYTFSAPGTYTYHCALHPHMTGTVIVN